VAGQHEPKKGLRFSEVMVLVGALGVLISVAVPSYLRMVRSDRVNGILASAVELRDDLSRWIERTTAPAESGGRALPAAPLQAVVELYNRTGQEPRAEAGAVVVEPAGLPAGRCARDGKIHLVPLADAGGSVDGAVIVVTSDRHRGGPADDGLLAEYRIRVERAAAPGANNPKDQAVTK